MTSDDRPTPAELIGFSREGLAVLDDDGRYLSINAAGARMLGADADNLLGTRSAFLDHIAPPPPAADRAGVANEADGTLWIGTAEIEFTVRAIARNDEVARHLVRFQVTDPAVRDRRALDAFTRTVAIIACEDKLDVVLNRLATEVRDTVGMSTCAVILVDEDSGALHHVGAAGLPADYGERIELCRRQGAPLATMKAIDEARLVVSHGFRDAALADDRWSPVHDILKSMNWDTYVAVPLVVRDRVIGALAGFLTEGRSPHHDDLQFIAAMADHAAIAIANAQMFARLELQAAREERRKLARDMHDSVTQALFSLSLRTKAMELSIDPDTSPEMYAQAQQIHQLVSGAQTEMRALIMHRRPTALGEEGLIPAIRQHVAALAAREAMTLEVEADDYLELDETLEEDLFMVVGEALHNVVKHARASRGQVIVERSRHTPASLRVTIMDDGVGLTQTSDGRESFGLRSMSERVAAHGGTLSIRDRSDMQGHDHGTIVQVVVPIQDVGGRS